MRAFQSISRPVLFFFCAWVFFLSPVRAEAGRDSGPDVYASHDDISVDIVSSDVPSEWEGMVKINEEIKRSGEGSFELSGKYQTELISSRMIPVAMNRRYILSAWMRSLDEEFPASGYLGLRMYDENERPILICNVAAFEDTETLLAADAHEGEWELKVAKNSEWMKRQRSVIAFDVRGGYDDLPNFNLSPQIESIIDKDSYYQVNLQEPLRASYRSGAHVRLHSPYKMPFYWAAEGWMPEEWVEFSVAIEGEARSGIAHGRFWPGTKYVRVFAWFGNWNRIPCEKAVLLVDDIRFSAPTGFLSAAAVSAIEINRLDEAVVIIENYLQENELEITVELEICGEVIGSKNIAVNPAGSVPMVFSLPFDLEGEQVINAVIKFDKPAVLPVAEKDFDFSSRGTSKVFNPAGLMRISRVSSEETGCDIWEWEGRRYVSIAADESSDLYAEIYKGWDENFFYLAVSVEDDEHFNTKSGTDIWNGDSLQFAFVPGGGIEPFNLGMALTTYGIQTHQWTENDTDVFEKSEYKVVRNEEEKNTLYQLKIPLEILGFKTERGGIFGFNAAVFQDNDGTGHDYWIQITPGLAGGWQPHLFDRFILWD